MKSLSALLMAIALVGVSACAQQQTSGMPGSGHGVAAGAQDVPADTATALATPPDIAARAPPTSDTLSAR